MSSIEFALAQRISGENQLAAVVLQRWFRGCSARRRVWSFGGEGTARAAVRIQKAWRGRRGRLLALRRLRERLEARAWVLSGFFRIIQAKKRRRQLRVLRWNQAATKVQAAWRQRVARRLYLALQQRWRTDMALRIQQRVRARQARCVARFLRESYPRWQERIHNWTTQYVSGQLPADLGSFADAADATPEQLVHASLLWLLGPGKLDLATRIAEVCTTRFPESMRGWCALFVCYCCNWTCRDRTGLIDEDMLHKAMAVLQRIRARCADAHAERGNDDNKEAGTPRPKVVAFEPVDAARSELFQFEELAYFVAAAKLSRGSGRSLLAHGACQILRMHITSVFHTASPPHYQHRIPRIFQRYLQRTHGWAKVGAQLQVDMLDVFLQQHVVVATVTRDFPGGRLLGCSQAHTPPSSSRRRRNRQQPPPDAQVLLYDEESGSFVPRVVEDPLAGIPFERCTSPRCTVQLTIARAGELFVISGNVVPSNNNNNNNGAAAAAAACVPAATVTPLVITANETVQLYTMGRQWLASLEREPYEAIIQKPRQDVVAEYAFNKLRLVLAAGETAARPRLKIVIPMLHYDKLKRNLQREEDFACRVLQRAFKGFAGRAMWRRLQFPLAERSRQLKLLEEQRARLKRYRDLRHNSATKIQRMVRDRFHRAFLVVANKAAIVIQATFRGYRARVLRAQMELRQRVGPAVECVLKRGVVISGIPVHLSVHRCGLNYKFSGLAADGSIYKGACYSDQVGELVLAFNQQHPAEPPIRPWQQERICALLVKNLAIVSDIPQLTDDLAKQNSAKVIVVRAGASGRGVLDYRGQKRLLSDQRSLYEKYEKYEKRMRAKAQAMSQASSSSSSLSSARNAHDVLFSHTATKPSSLSTLEKYRKYVTNGT